ncbi:MAG: amidohydrolase [Oscillibacter sp.]|nr:amidohydrolase [Oscillibacter sp.]
MKDSIAVSRITEIAPELCALSQDLWDHPEIAFSEYYASQRLKDYLAQNGFSITTPVPELPTAFVATWGSGSPRIGLLAEYDALPGFSQKTQTTEDPVSPGAAGHACGHNLMGAAHAGAAVAVKQEMEDRNLPGTVIYYGCPAEEVLTGKVFMARAGVFDGLDCALNFHPNVVNGIDLKRCAGINNVKFKFHGTVSHAAARPFDGRSASDAAELMNVGANYLREHIPEGVRLHYVTTSGGRAPNIVANFAETWYHIRARDREPVEDVYKRLIDVAKGAALMTGTRVEVDLQGGCYPTLQNKVLAETVREAMESIGAPTYTEEEKAYAAALNASCPQSPRRAYKVDPSIAIFEGIKGPFNEGGFAYNASDIGDVSHLLPTVMFGTVCSNFLSDLHSWQFAACTGHSIGQKGMLFAAKVLAAAAVKLMTDPQRRQAALEEWKETMDGTQYLCPIPPEVMPPVVKPPV